MIHEADLLTAEWVQSAQVLARWTARTERVSSHQLHHEPRTKRSERGVQLMASDKATQYPANGFSFRGLTSYLANNNNTQTNNDFSRPVAGSSAADRPRAPAALGERESGSDFAQEGPAELISPPKNFIGLICGNYGAHEHLGGAFANFGSQVGFLCSDCAESDRIDYYALTSDQPCAPNGARLRAKPVDSPCTPALPAPSPLS